MKKILVIAAHPDDEILGCGATIAKHINEKDEVYVMIMTPGVDSRNKNKKEKIVDKNVLSKSVFQCHKFLGIKKTFLNKFPDNRMDKVNLLSIVKKIENVLNKVKPEIIYTHHYGDLNVDHQIVHRATVTACRPSPKNLVKKIYTFEVVSSTEWQSNSKEEVFIPNYFVNIDTFIKKKIKALKYYKNEMRPFPHSRSLESIRALARWRGASVGLKAAEAFCLVRQIKK